MNIANFLRGVAGVVLADVNSIFPKAKAAVNAAPFLPSNLKTDINLTLTDAQSDLDALEGLVGTLAAQASADAVDDATTLVVNLAGAVSGGKSLSQLSAAEKTILQKAWTVARAQGDTLVSQLQAGLDPTAQKPPPAPEVRLAA